MECFLCKSETDGTSGKAGEVVSPEIEGRSVVAICTVRISTANLPRELDPPLCSKCYDQMAGAAARALAGSCIKEGRALLECELTDVPKIEAALKA